MSATTKDNWDDSSDDEGDTPPDPLCKAKEEYHEVQFTEDSNGEEHPADDESGVEGDPLYEQEDPLYEQEDPLYEWGVQGGDPLSDDDYDDLDEYDKKLGRYVKL